MEEMNTMNEVMMENEATEMVPAETESIACCDVSTEAENSSGKMATVVVGGICTLAVIGGVTVAKKAWPVVKNGGKKVIGFFSKKNKEEAEPDEPVVDVEAREVEPEKDEK